MRSFVEEALLSPDSSVNEFFNPRYVRDILRRHQEQSEDFMRQIYLLLSFELWHRAFIRGGGFKQ
jgi:asparagine synthase (glutamine-hydrolysing)